MPPRVCADYSSCPRIRFADSWFIATPLTAKDHSSGILQNSRKVLISKVPGGALMRSVMREMVYIDAGGRLYRGFGRCYPTIVWHQEGARWTVCELPTPQDWDWGDLV